MTLIEVHGAGEGRCDARCYNATGGKCRCVCGGAFHGIGLDAAVDKIGDRLPEFLDRYGASAIINAIGLQRKLGP